MSVLLKHGGRGVTPAVPITRLAPEDVVLLVGKRRSGKSHRAKLLLSAEQSGGARVVCFDPHDEYSQLGRKTRATNLGPLRQRCTIDELLGSGGKQLDARRLSLSVVPRTDNEGQLVEDCKDFISLVRATGDLTVCFDEVGEYEAGARRELNSAATQSRHWGDSGCPIIFVAQRMVQVPKSARDQASYLFSGLQNDPDDLKQLQKITGSPDFAARVSRLPRPGLLEWRDTQGVKSP